jgi:tripartite ATP-independent transporter DctP family solute receptor
MKKGLTLLLAVMLIIPLTTGVSAKTWTLKYGHVDSPTMTADDHIGGLFLKNYIESRSQGRIKVEIYPASQLGNFRELIEGVQLGTLELANTTVGGMNQFFPQIQVTDIPYMYRDDLVAEKVGQGPFYDDLREAILKKTGNVRLVAVGNTGRWRSFFTTKKQIKSAKDLKGVKMRTINSPLQIEMVKFLGGNPTPVAWGELYTALQSGVVEGTKNAISDVVGKKFHENVKYLCVDEHAYLYGYWWMSDSWLKSLPKDLQTLVIDGVKQAANVQMEFNKYLDIVMTEEFLKSGGTIYVPNEAEKATFKAAKPVIKKWFVTNIPDGQLWYDKLEAAVKKAEEEVDAEIARVLK